MATARQSWQKPGGRSACTCIIGTTPIRWPDLDDFAAQIAELDLVISVDSATVHLAGGLGVPVWTLLHYAPNWRWLLDRDDTPWYSSMQLVRQPEFGQWEPVFASVAESLRPVGHLACVEDRIRDRPFSRVLAATRPTPAPRTALRPPLRGDPQANEERTKYAEIWKHDDYRRFSPGAVAIEKVGLVAELRKHGVRTILDAGCGSGKLMWRLINEYPGEFDVHGFDIADNCLDPCFGPIKDRVLTVGCLWNPDDFTKVYDAVVCCDVMEHIPTDRVPAVLANLRKSTRKFAFFSISVIPDAFGPMLIGEALHLTVQKPNWWFAKLALAGFKTISYATSTAANGHEIAALRLCHRVVCHALEEARSDGDAPTLLSAAFERRENCAARVFDRHARRAARGLRTG